MQDNEKKDHETLKDILSMIGTVVVVFIIMNFFLINAVIPSASMEDTIMTGDRVFGVRFLNNYKRGDIVIFNSEEKGEYLIKRVIGLPGETVEIKDRGDGTAVVYIDGKELEEDYLKEDMVFTSELTITLPEDGYFLMGDNRNDSYDARFWQEKVIYADDIIGIAKLRYWPLSRFGFLQ